MFGLGLLEFMMLAVIGVVFTLPFWKIFSKAGFSMTLKNGVASERARASWVRGLLIAWIAVSAIAIVSGIGQYNLLDRAASGARITQAEVAANDARQGMITLLQVLVFWTTAICWLVWLHRAYSNLGLMGTRKSDYTPGWAIGWWYIPIMNLFRPYQVTKELWLRSAKRNVLDSIKEFAAPGVVMWWWAVYIISAFLALALRRQPGQSIDELQGVALMTLFLDGLGIVSALLALTVVSGID